MGARGPAPKDPKRRQRRNAQPAAVVVHMDEVRLAKMPELGAGMLASTAQAWQDFWSSGIPGQTVLATDLPALRRLFTLYDERERAYRGYAKERLVLGSQGQQVINPLAKVMATADAEIRALEDRFGLSPMARMRLGIAMGEAKKSLEAMNRELEDDDEADGLESDPRLLPRDAEG